jgi:pSer/pThr/pTyr-binding forkhead associated (FHA) protein
MVQFTVLSGRRTGLAVTAPRFPFVVGRNKDADLCFEEEGVWERHLEVDLRMPDGFLVQVNPGALATVNGQPVREAALRNGDLIGIGPVKIRFWLGQVQQVDLRWREFLTWFALALLCLAQIALIYRLMR